MSLSDLAALGSFISGFAVLISLIFLYFQLRQIGQQVAQAERNQQASIQQTRTNRLVDLYLRAAADSSLSEAIGRALAGSDDLTANQWRQFIAFSRASFLSGEDAFYQRKHGLMQEDAFENLVGYTKTTLVQPAVRLAWRRLRSNFGREFVAFFDKSIVEIPAADVEDDAQNLLRWKADFVAERAKGLRNMRIDGNG
jgi:hypothetical protein